MSKQVFNGQARKIIHNVLIHMQKEKDEGVHNVNQVQQRTAEATGTSIRTVRNILSESKKMKSNSDFKTPGKKRRKTKTITGLNEFAKGVIKRCIHNYHVTETELPTLKKLHQKLQKDIDFKGSATSLSLIIKGLGFKWRRTESRQNILIENNGIRLKRIQYLQQIKKYRKEGRPIVYVDESVIYSSYHKIPISKGPKLEIVLAGSEDGFVPNSLLMFRSGSKSGDFRDTMNFVNYEKWLRTKLIPNLSPNTVVVMDDAPYHNKVKETALTPYSKKEAMELWLKNRRIPFSKQMLKPELYRLIHQNKSTENIFVVDEILNEHDHVVLRPPPFHPDLNPMQIVWKSVKDYVAETTNKLINDDINVNRTMQMAEEKINQMNKKEWVSWCKKVKLIEDKYSVSDHIVDTMTDSFPIYSGGCSESESESDRNEDSSEEESDSDEMETDYNVPSSSTQ